MKAGRWAVVAVVAVMLLGIPLASPAPHMRTSSQLAEGGGPEGYEPIGVLITKSGAAYLVCKEKGGEGLVYVPLAVGEEMTQDA